MKRAQSKYVCQSCGQQAMRWTGQCPGCSTWNSLVEELVAERGPGRRSRRSGSARGVPIVEVEPLPEERLSTGIPEFDRVLGGGIVPGSVVLVGGDPGIGKSTLMLQMASLVQAGEVLYVSGEESASQIKLRSARLGAVSPPELFLLTETDIDTVEEVIRGSNPAVVVVDSIQTMYRSGLESAPGTVGQVREVAALMMKVAKSTGSAVFLIGHVTKEGTLAGPKVVEHIVDAVLQFEGERHYAFRVLRSMKNRFGPTNEIGIFEMRENGLQEVRHPSESFLSQRMAGSSGSVVVATLEGTRPLLLEVQALVTPTSYGVPQRTTTGFDGKRLQMLLAVLEKRVGIRLGQYDVFVNIAGGVRVDEPAADLAVALAVVSSIRDRVVDSSAVAVGEIGLGGEVRAGSQIEKRIQEAHKLGFKKMVVSSGNLRNLRTRDGLNIVGVLTIDEAIREMIRGT